MVERGSPGEYRPRNSYRVDIVDQPRALVEEKSMSYQWALPRLGSPPVVVWEACTLVGRGR